MRIIEDVRSVFARDPAARNVFEILTCYQGFRQSFFIDSLIFYGAISYAGLHALYPHLPDGLLASRFILVRSLEGVFLLIMEWVW